MVEPFYTDERVTLHLGDCIEVLRTLPANSVHAVVTSPPYLNLRSYLAKDNPLKVHEIGSEPTPEAFIQTMVDVFREVRMVLRDDGTLWMNLGDSYGDGGKGVGRLKQSFRRDKAASAPRTEGGQLMNIPHRVAEALRADGWIWRQTIVWSKKSPMPESLSGWSWQRCRVKVDGTGWTPEARPEVRNSDQCKTRSAIYGTSGGEIPCPFKAKWTPCPGCPKCEPNGGYVLRRGAGRCTTAHEYVFLFAKKNRYFWDAHASLEPVAMSSKAQLSQDVGSQNGSTRIERKINGPMKAVGDLELRNMRSVFEISSEPTRELHFACVDSETECLTAEGWKRHDELRAGEFAAQFDMTTQKLSWAAIETVVSYAVENQEMVVGKSRDYDFWLTPNHRCVVYRRQRDGRKPKIVAAEALRREHQIPITGEWEDAGIGPGLLWAELVGWYIAEGHAKKNGLGVEIYQSKSNNPDFCDRIQFLLSGVEAEYESATYFRMYRGRMTKQMAFHIRGFTAAKLRMLCPDKAVPATCLTWSNAECQAILDGLCMGDGHAREGGRICFVQKRPDIANAVHALAIRCGLSATISRRGTGGIFALHFARRTTRSFRGTNGKGSGLARKTYSGVVWCPKLPSGTWVARRGGRVFITGNTFPSELVRRCLSGSVSAKGVCPHCGSPWAPVLSKERVQTRPALANKIWKHADGDKVGQRSDDSPNLELERHIAVTKLHGYRPTCGCPTHEPVGATILDPFSGLATTGQTARHLGHRYVGIDLNEAYMKIAAKRIYEPPRWWLRQQKPKAKVKRSKSDRMLFE